MESWIDSVVVNLFERVRLFSPEDITLGEPIKDDRVELFERKIQFVLPADYKLMLKMHNGFSVMGTEVNGLDIRLLGGSVDEIYDYEHRVNSNLPSYFLPISYDGRGNFYCIDLSQNDNGLSPIVFWQSNFDYVGLNDVEMTNGSFMDWVEEVMINWNS